MLYSQFQTTGAKFIVQWFYKFTSLPWVWVDPSHKMHCLCKEFQNSQYEMHAPWKHSIWFKTTVGCFFEEWPASSANE